MRLYQRIQKSQVLRRENQGLPPGIDERNSMKFTTIEQILQRLVSQPPTVLETGCMVWPGESDGAGYGRATLNGRRARVHILIVESLVCSIPPGHHVHHLCKNRACANREHLELVNTKEHGERHRKLFCPKGHPYATEGRPHNGSRDCLTCHREREYRRSQKQKETRQYVRGPYQIKQRRRPMTPEKVREVRRLARTGMRYTDVGRLLDLSVSHVSQIVSRKSWAHLSDG